MISCNNDENLKPDLNGKTSNIISLLMVGGITLPILPEVNLKLIKACNSGKPDIHELAGLIKMDPALSLKVMDMYYSCRHRNPERLDSLEGALKVIGIDAIKIMVSCSSAGSIFDGIITERNFDLKAFWRHSLKCAFLAEIISRDIPDQSPDEAYLAGLFHDTGRLILFSYLPYIYSRLLSGEPDHGNIISEEKKAIGMDHCNIASRLIDRWHFYPFMADAVLYHHHPVEKVARALSLVKILYLANLLAGQDISNQKDICNAAKILLGLTGDRIEEYLLSSETRLNNALGIFEIEESPSGHIQANNDAVIDARFSLASEVRDTSLAAYALQDIWRAKDKGSVLQNVRQCFQILFGQSEIFFFLYDRDEKTLKGHCAKDDGYAGLIDGLGIGFDPDCSILCLSLHSKAPVDSFTYQRHSELTITDSQLIHLTGKDGILCLPMFERDEWVGVIVLGMDNTEYSFLSKRINLLNLIVRQCSIALYDWNRKENKIRGIQSEQSSQTGVLSRKIIHEINNPLSVIKNYLKVLAMKLSDYDVEHDEIRIINDEINRIAKMLRRFSVASDKESDAVEGPVDLNVLLLDIIRLANGSLADGSGVKIHLDHDTSMPEIITERDSLKQVFINLIKNAVEAMPGGGNIGIKTSFIKDRKKDNEGEGSGRFNGRIQLSVTDDGPGISDEIRAALFNEFVTSKDGHEGLGLSIVKNLINKLNGSIACENVKGKGAGFIIDLPLKAADRTGFE